MKEKEFTVDELISFLTKLNICGDYKVMIGERPLYTDEYAILPDKKALVFRGHLYHEDITNKAMVLKNEITKSIEKFYRKE